MSLATSLVQGCRAELSHRAMRKRRVRHRHCRGLRIRALTQASCDATSCVAVVLCHCVLQGRSTVLLPRAAPQRAATHAQHRPLLPIQSSTRLETNRARSLRDNAPSMMRGDGHYTAPTQAPSHCGSQRRAAGTMSPAVAASGERISSAGSCALRAVPDPNPICKQPILSSCWLSQTQLQPHACRPVQMPHNLPVRRRRRHHAAGTRSCPSRAITPACSPRPRHRRRCLMVGLVQRQQLHSSFVA